MTSGEDTAASRSGRCGSLESRRLQAAEQSRSRARSPGDMHHGPFGKISLNRTDRGSTCRNLLLLRDGTPPSAPRREAWRAVTTIPVIIIRNDAATAASRSESYRASYKSRAPGRDQAAVAVADRPGREGEPDQGRGRLTAVLRGLRQRSISASADTRPDHRQVSTILPGSRAL